MGRRPTRAAAALIATTTLVLAASMTGASGVGVATAQESEPVTVRQDGECFRITPLEGNRSVKAFYDYRSTIEGNPYTTVPGPGFSSEGTVDLQRPETSLLFLHEDPNGTLSLVVVHGARETGEDGGAASFEMTGLPEDGTWAVKDDEYDSPNNTDSWRHGPTTAAVDWAWGESATDGGAYAGLGDDFAVTVDPAFNAEAALFTRSDWGVVDDWEVVSGNRSDPARTELDRFEPVTISTEPCDGSTVDTTDDDEGGEGINR